MELLEYCDKYLNYDPTSGIITIKQKRYPSDRKQIGDEAGWVQKSKKYPRKKISIMGKEYMYHRIAWLIYNKVFPNLVIDHIDGNPLNNKIDNLRDVSMHTNMKNMKMLDTNTSGVTGVSWQKRYERWDAEIYHNNKRIWLGASKDFKEAVKLRKEAETKYGYSPRNKNK